MNSRNLCKVMAAIGLLMLMAPQVNAACTAPDYGYNFACSKDGWMWLPFCVYGEAWQESVILLADGRNMAADSGVEAAGCS